MASRKLASNKETGDASAFETTSFQPGPNTVVLLFVTSARPVFGGGVPKTPTITGNGLLWVEVLTVLYGGNRDRRLTCFRASGAAPTAGSAVIDFGGETQDFCAWSIFEYGDVDVTKANGSAAVAQAVPQETTGQSLTASLSPSADPNRNVVVGAIAVDSSTGAAIDVAPGAGFTEIDEQSLTQFLSKAGTLHTQDAPATNPVISWTWDSAQSAAAIILEIKAAPPKTDPGDRQTSPADDQALVERLAPVMFFHPDEKYFPSDAKRFVEHAALWTARVPGDDKNGWGGAPGDPFPRQPTVPAKGLAASAGEPGDFRFDDPLGAGNDHRFLELGGWKDATETHESGVTNTTTNVYSDRTAITALYDGELEPSRFWYHAEVFHQDRLRVIANRVPGVNLEPVLSKLTKPTMVCYYFFFPAHDQSVGSAGGCTGIEAREVSSHAGDWQCLAILGEGAATAFTPKFLGITGSRPSGETQFPAYQYDDDQNTAMMVSPWSAANPAVTDGHPRLYVAAGTHSLYVTPGPQAVDPYPAGKQPEYCGTLDTPTPPGRGDSEGDLWLNATRDIAVLLAKMIAGGAFGFLGATAALVACIAEISQYRSPFAPFAAEPGPDGADPDQPPAAPGAGKTVKPATITVPDAGADVVDWRSRPGSPLTIDGRVYDCMVDRAKQLWWPNPDTTTGFNGRWGQHVTADSLSRRAGPRFPNYPQMFLLGLADGLGRTPPLFTLGG
ncbi:hypothetical protein [Mycobacterium sp. M26]|uniref:hypothetical protein n=1 Tax=Mycobacterium sp. M26 TaxID=1762962 RepID=UPI00073F4CAF|nr:hypothetical protein [Mycobacterium sp. M26]